LRHCGKVGQSEQCGIEDAHIGMLGQPDLPLARQARCQFGKFPGDDFRDLELGCGTLGGEQVPQMAARIARGLDVLSTNQRRDRIEKLLDPFRPSRPFTAVGFHQGGDGPFCPSPRP